MTHGISREGVQWKGRKYEALAGLVVAGLSSLGCGETSPERAARVEAAAVGDPVRRVELPAGVDCSGDGFSHVAISVAVVPAGALDETPALPDDKALLATSCRQADGTNIYFIDPGSSDPSETPVTGTLVHTLTTSVATGFPRFGWGALAFRGDLRVPDLIACTNPATSADPHEVYSVNLMTGATAKLFNAAAATPGKPFCDGLAWDPASDTVWMSSDVSSSVHHFTTTGIELPGSPIDISSLVAEDGVTRCFVDGVTGNSGIEVVGNDLFLACNGEATIFQVSQADGTFVRTFSSGANRAEDLECDSLTFAPDTSVMWTKDAFDPDFLSFEVPPGSCGLCREQQRLDLIEDLTPEERANLSSLLQQYLTSEVIVLHSQNAGLWHGNLGFFPGHRGYIAGFELWLLNVIAPVGDPRFSSKFVPLPKWDPANAIPIEFQLVDADCSGCPSLNDFDLRDNCNFSAGTLGTGSMECDPPNPPAKLGWPLPEHFKYHGNPTPPSGVADVCQYPTVEAVRAGMSPLPDLEGTFHGSVHCQIGGTMCSVAIASGAPIFWAWHALLDDVSREYECSCKGSCQTCVDLYAPILSSAFARIGNARARGAPAVPQYVSAPIGFWWWFEDRVTPPDLSPDVTVDHAGFDFQGIMRGGAEVAVGIVGQSLALDGRDDYVEVRDRFAGEVESTDFTLDAWVKTSEDGVQSIVDKRDRNGAGYALFLDEGLLTVHVGTRRGSVLAQAETPSVADGQWHHVAAVINRSLSNGSTLFIDGRPALAFDASSLVGDAASREGLWIGRSKDRDHRHRLRTRHHRHHRHVRPRDRGFFAGEIDELDLFRHALSGDLVASIYAAGSAGKFGSQGNLPTFAGRRPCLEELGAMIAAVPQAAFLVPLYERVLAAVARGNRLLARRLVRRILDSTPENHEGLQYIDVELLLHSIHHQAEACLDVPPLAQASSRRRR